MQNNQNNSSSNSPSILGIIIGISIVVLEIVGLIAAFTKSIGVGFAALFVPPYAWYLGFKKITEIF
jgi:hypothetical protein